MKGGFNVVQWMSSSRRFLSTIAPEELSRPHLDFTSELLPVERALGILLDWETDHFMFKVELKQATTVREILQGLSRIHDPLGFIAPAVLPGRILMQDVWQTCCEWDDVFEKEFRIVWSNCIIELKSLKNLRIARCTHKKKKTIQLELLAFSDARENGYG